MSNFEDQIKSLIDIMLESSVKETMETYSETVNKLRELATEKDFFNKLQYAQNKFNTIVSEVIVPRQDNSYIVKFIVSGLYEHFFRQLMEKTEGSSCCADKSRFVRNMTLKALRENTNLSLFEDYTEHDQIKEGKERQTYWSPKTIPDTNTAIRMFWDWYMLRI